MSEFAAMESAKNGAVDAYIAARPQLDSIHNRRIFEAGFERGWQSTRREIERKDAAIAELVWALKGCLPRVPPATCDGIRVVISKYDIPKDGL